MLHDWYKWTEANTWSCLTKLLRGPGPRAWPRGANAPRRRHWEARRPKVSHFLPDQFLQPDPMQFFILKTEIERRWCDGFVDRAVQLRQKRVCQCLFHRYALFGVNLKHFSHEIQSSRGRARKLTAQGWRRLVRQLSHKTSRFFGSNKVKFRVLQLAKLFGNDCELKECSRSYE